MNPSLHTFTITRSGLDGSLVVGLIFLFLLLGSLIAYAQTTSWTGATSVDWNTAGNWSVGVPTAGSDVRIQPVPTFSRLSGPASAPWPSR